MDHEIDNDQPETRTINRADYADRQAQILSALALLDDLGQDAYDHGQVELSARLHQAHADVERFRYFPERAGGRISTPELPSHADGSCGCTDPYCQA